MAVLLEVRSTNGNFNFTEPRNPFLDVEQGKGLEPGDPRFTEKIFARSLLKQGATLALETLHEKELIFPLKLKANTKTELTELVQRINTIINTPGARVVWQDVGAQRPTFFELISGQLDDEFNYRMGEHNWLPVRMRLFCQPLGYYAEAGARALSVPGGTTVATATGPVVTFRGTETLLGDAPALLQAEVSPAASTSSTSICFAALSVLPSPSYVPLILSASMVTNISKSGGEFEYVQDATVPGGTVIHLNKPETSGNVKFPAWTAGPSAAPYAGEQRLLMVVRVPTSAKPVPFETIKSIAATPIATYAWQVLDMGVVTTASSTLAIGSFYQPSFTVIQPAASAGITDIACVIQLPDSQTVWLKTPEVLGNEGYITPVVFDGVLNTAQIYRKMGVPASGILDTSTLFPGDFTEVTNYTRGGIPALAAQASAPVLAGVFIAQPWQNAKFFSLNTQITLRANVLERTRYTF